MLRSITGKHIWCRLLALVAVLSHSIARAELEGLTESEMSEVDGAGIGLVLENFKFSHGTDQPDINGQQARIFRISGIKSTDGRDVDITVNHLYIAGANSNYGETLTPVNLGRLLNPWRIDVVDGNTIGIDDKAVLEFAAPAMMSAAEGYDCMGGSATAGSGTCSSRPATSSYIGERADIGMQMNVAVGADRSANINIHAKSAVVDGSYLRLWGDDGRRQMVGQFKLNFFSPELSINACSQDGSACGSRIVMSDFALQLAIGNELQPVFLDVDGTGNFVVDVAAIPKPAPGSIGGDGLRGSSDSETWDFYEAYYTNPEYRSNLSIGNFSVGNRDFGSARVQGMLIQHLNITTKDLAP
ncbi:MAG: hypothetical protein EP339_04950 [Gammaproteobacteria bacterium]|uniref:Large exoproteins involved in heme utilization or adhesion n=1 Tax=Marinobacter nitratireducens TaxID=1137280 RepID=A0A072MWQ3_9GAMM|nr:hypothetical protein [Marinobacter nitratireducens]KEF29681.1 Large exoproteins involved in heme utilization or adhesion [Marinobacter nitratireducens]TNE77935.1 MAG: hypothetical protein EP339_04950 [Gammaproteobacteria bacterium]TNE96570.1 MAG: hypothetical protein EP328_07765 [Gammaproteobacteria bacterium]